MRQPWWVPESNEDFGQWHRVRDIEDLVVVGNWAYSFAVPYDTEESMLQEFTAVGLARHLGLKSIDYTLKSYVRRHWTSSALLPKEASPVYHATNAARRLVTEALKRTVDMTAPLAAGRFAARGALVRLQGTFQAATLLTRSGRHFESVAMQRLILEQLAWIHAIHQDESDAFWSLQPTACLTTLKKLIPEAGRVYGELSDTAHIHPRTTPRYISAEGDALVLHFNQPWVWRALDAQTLLMLADWYAAIAEIISSKRGVKRKAVVRAEGQWKLRSDRPSLGILQECRDALHPLIA